VTAEVRFAVVGAGGFARFAVSQFVRRQGARLVAVHDTDRDAVAQLRLAHPGVRVFDDLPRLLADPAIDLVYIASPPFLHYEQSLAALCAGKHVICEKPAALELRHAQELARLAQERNLLFVVNLMQRYNPLYHAVKAVIDSALLGDFLHGYFENYASDEFLTPGHWFWDEAKSGGIFIEHGVHFFDLFAGWFGDGKVIAAQKIARPGFPHVWDIAQCSVLYAGHAPVHFYHAFNQPKLLDRQELRLQFERGEITLHEWVPTRLVMRAVCTAGELERLKSRFPGADVSSVQSWDAVQTARGRFKSFGFERSILLDTGEPRSKAEVYETLLGAMFDEQLRWLQDRSVNRTIDAANAVSSLAVATHAEQIAVRLRQS
jgi:predicted dehydrogenase